MSIPARPLDFSTFLVSLGTSALVQLGEAPEPESQQLLDPDLDAAQQWVEVLEILEVKTRGNLDEAEARLLKNLVYDLRRRLAERRSR